MEKNYYCFNWNFTTMLPRRIKTVNIMEKLNAYEEDHCRQEALGKMLFEQGA